VLACNKSALAMLDLTAQQVHGEEPVEWAGTLKRPDGSTWTGADTPDRVALATGETQRDQMVGVSFPGGVQRWLRVNSTYVRGDDPGTAYVVSSMTDETDRFEAKRLAREERQEKRRRVLAVLEAPESLAILVQPIVDLRTGAVVGGEALSRFRGPPDQAPNVWFAEAEEAGLGLDLELLAVRRAVGQLAGLPGCAYLSVNVSPGTATADELYALLSDDREAAGRIVLELTEHTRVPDYSALQAALQGLRRLGVRVAVDDAGSGFASLRHILKLEPDFVKLDLDLVRNIDRDPARRALAAGLLTFAHQIGAKLIGEGIENERELAALMDVGVVFGQGYHLGRPALPPLPATVRGLTTQLAPP
jgi:EAL domain-containing protein (putative c-di-GMP-specific phosphodiesterase class I)